MNPYIQLNHTYPCRYIPSFNFPSIHPSMFSAGSEIIAFQELLFSPLLHICSFFFPTVCCSPHMSRHRDGCDRASPPTDLCFSLKQQVPFEYPVGYWNLEVLHNIPHIKIVTKQDNVDLYSCIIFTFPNNFIMVLDRSSVKLQYFTSQTLHGICWKNHADKTYYKNVRNSVYSSLPPSKHSLH